MMTEPIKQLSVKLPPTTYNLLLKESEKREGLMPAPTRTARQIITEYLEGSEQ